MEEQVLNFQDIADVIRRHAIKIAVIVGACVAASLVSYKTTPKRFKSVASLSIKASYFQTPLLGDFVSGAREQSQMEAEKEGLIRQALDDEFIDSLGDSFKLFKENATPKEHVFDREGLRKRIEYLSLNSTTYQFAAVAGDAQVAARMNEFVVDHVMDKFIAARRQELVKFRESLRRQLEAMGLSSAAAGGTNPLSAPEQVRDELAEVEAKITVLEGQYTSSHPSVVTLKRKADALRRTLENPNLQAPGPEAARGKAADKIDVKDPKFELSMDIMRKLNYLDVILQLEKDRRAITYLELVEKPNVPMIALYPKLPNFVLAGFLVGALLSGLLVGYFEVKRASYFTPGSTATNFGVPMLGTLPCLENSASKMMEPHAGAKLSRQLFSRRN